MDNHGSEWHIDHVIPLSKFDLNIPDECRHELTERLRQTKDNPILELSDNIIMLT